MLQFLEDRVEKVQIRDEQMIIIIRYAFLYISSIIYTPIHDLAVSRRTEHLQTQRPQPQKTYYEHHCAAGSAG
jgi:hypothetical protein